LSIESHASFIDEYASINCTLLGSSLLKLSLVSQIILNQDIYGGSDDIKSKSDLRIAVLWELAFSIVSTAFKAQSRVQVILSSSLT